VVPPKTLRRKLQKKAKRKGWTNCPLCGMHGRFQVMQNIGVDNEMWIMRCCSGLLGCGWGKVLVWPGRVAER
jgi:RNase P subunit RPR2